MQHHQTAALSQAISRPRPFGGTSPLLFAAISICCDDQAGSQQNSVRPVYACNQALLAQSRLQLPHVAICLGSALKRSFQQDVVEWRNYLTLFLAHIIKTKKQKKTSIMWCYYYYYWNLDHLTVPYFLCFCFGFLKACHQAIDVCLFAFLN